MTFRLGQSLTMSGLSLLSFAGLPVLWRRNRYAGLVIAAICLFFPFTYWFIQIYARYRLPIQFAFLLPAGAAIAWGLDRVQGLRSGRSADVEVVQRNTTNPSISDRRESTTTGGSVSAWNSILAFMMRLCCVVVIAIIAVLSAHGQPRSDRKEPVAEPAIPAILAAFRTESVYFGDNPVS
jgi:hypothetical protein